MRKSIDFKNTKLYYTDEGQGTPVVFLHGYLESLDIWTPFTEKLISDYRVIRIDIPGHGLSGIVEKVHTMDLMAEFVVSLLEHLSVDKCVLFGHSMGGYVSLAIAENHPSYLLGFSLFHSAPFSDNEEKKANRDREIELVRQGKKELVVNTSVPKVFANDNLEILSHELERFKGIARQTPEDGIIAILEGMKARPDRSYVVKNFPGPFLWIFGRKDNHISYDAIKEKINLGAQGQIVMLENSGHIGFLEEPEKSLELVKSFIDLCVQ